MSAPRLFFGCDTSYYTTSLALVDDAARVVWDFRRPLAVPAGERGLRPSEVTFRHLVHLNGALWPAGASPRAVRAVAASVRPRSTEDSYLPFFLAGEQFARAVAASLEVPFVATTHQEMHLRAALLGLTHEIDARATDGAGPSGAGPFLAWHLSGGTTELLLVRPAKATSLAPGARPDPERPLPPLAWSGYDTQVVGGSEDLFAGQLVDRTGVLLGLPFPSGPHLEALAERGSGRLELSGRARGGWMSLSGPESQVRRLIAGGAAGEEVARAVFDLLARLLIEATLGAVRGHGVADVVFAGGVAANRFVRGRVSRGLSQAGVRAHFTLPHLATDNAVGVALAAWAAAGGSTAP